MRVILFLFLGALALACLLTIVANASVSGLRPYCPGKGSLCTVVPSSGGGGYTGPCDVVASPKVFFGIRACSSAIAAAGTQKIVDLRRASDNVTCTAIVATNGTIDLTVGTPCAGSTVTAWIGASSALVSKWYDQSGNGADAAQATAGSQPKLLINGYAPNSTPALQFTNQFVATSANIVSAQPYTFVSESERSANFTTQMDFIYSNGGISYYPGSTNQTAVYDGSSVIATASDSAAHSIQGIFNSSSSSVTVDGSTTSGTTGAGSASSTLYVGSEAGSFNCNICVIGEVGMWGSGFSAGNLSSMHSNMAAYYGSP